jgi:hypothetical protein
MLDLDKVLPVGPGAVVGLGSALRWQARRLMRSVIGRPIEQLPDGPAQMAEADAWICVFDPRAGSRARAVFETRDRAMRFAEHHANAVTPGGAPLKWEDAESAAVSTTALGEYLVARQNMSAQTLSRTDVARRRPEGDEAFANS